MTIKEAKKLQGKLVISYDAGYKLISRTYTPHGPYILMKITRAGLAILQGREQFRIPPSLLEKYDNT